MDTIKSWESLIVCGVLRSCTAAQLNSKRMCARITMRSTCADDFVFCKVLSNEEVCKTLLQEMLSIKIDRLEYVESQKALDFSLDAKGVRFDVYVKDSSKIYDIEMQKITSPDLPQRARYYQSMIDINTIRKGEPYRALKEQNPEVKAFLEFLCCGNPRTNLTAKLQELVSETLHNEKWRQSYMTLEMIKQEMKEEGIQLGREQGLEQGARQKAIETARNFKNAHVDEAVIAQCTGLSVEEIAGL